MSYIEKFRFKHGTLDFPMTQEQIDEGKLKSYHSVFLPDNERVLFHPNKYPKPLMPEDGASFWSDFLEVVVRVDHARKKTTFKNLPEELKKELMPEGVFSDNDYLPEVFKSVYGIKSTYDLAMLVKADWPTDIMNKAAGWLYSKGYKERDFFSHKYTRFTDGRVLLARLIGEVIHEVSPTCFAFKWYYGRPRPQEVAQAWAAKTIDAPKGIDVAIANMIGNKRQAIAKDSNKFPMYPHPPHCSLPAMHAAVAAIQILMSVWFKLDDYGFSQMKKVGACTSLGRDFGGVHYRNDSLFGMKLGEDCVAVILPKLLEKHGVKDVDMVKEVIAEHRTDWTAHLEAYK